jgi:hypothetical protein
MDLDTKQRWRVYLVAIFGIGGVAFGWGIQFGLAMTDGRGWEKVGIGAFIFLCLAFVLWTLLWRPLGKSSDA